MTSPSTSLPTLAARHPHPTPHPTPPYIPQIRLYQDWLAQQHGLRFESYDALWRWSVTEVGAFWQSVWDFCDVRSPTPHSAALIPGVMPNVQWFPGAQLNYASQVLRHTDAAHAAGMPAILSEDECGNPRSLSWPELRGQVGALAQALVRAGVGRGDRVAAYLPNTPEAIVACLATVSVGAIWSICAPDMGTPAVLDRFKQIEPKVLIAADGIHYGGRAMDRSETIEALVAQLPTVQTIFVHETAFAKRRLSVAAPATYRPLWSTLAQWAQHQGFEPESLPFAHPLWIVYSSGTTGLPKPIVHGHGGIVLTLLALKRLGNDIGCSYEPNTWGERFFWYSSTGWVMWNAQMAGLATGTTICLLDGSPAGKVAGEQDWGTLWRFAARTGVTWFGAGAAFYASCMKAGLALSSCDPTGQLQRIRALGSTGSPLSEQAQAWGSAQMRALREAAAPSGGSAVHEVTSVGAPGRAAGPPQGAAAPVGGSAVHEVTSVGASIWWCNISGGTDFCGAFIGGNRELAQIPGEMQCRLLGCAVEAWDESGQAVVGAVGELVCTQPLPSMPLYFWNDPGNARYLSSYFDMYPGVWRHGDWLKVTEGGGCVIYGRSDTTINRQGLRMGTSEIYTAVEALPEVQDSLVVDLEYLGRDSDMPLFVVLTPGLALDDALKARINQAIKLGLSPRFVPNSIHQVQAVPRTLSGKKQELPIKKLLLGQPLAKVVNTDAMANPQSLDFFVAFAAQRASARP